MQRLLKTEKVNGQLAIRHKQVVSHLLVVSNSPPARSAINDKLFIARVVGLGALSATNVSKRRKTAEETSKRQNAPKNMPIAIIVT